MEVVKIAPRGYCHGVVSALKQMRDIAKDKSISRPIHVLGMVVHNQKIVEDFNALGLKTLSAPNKSRLELLDEVDEGTIVITAHGVSDAVYKKAQDKGLNIIDTTCRDVKTSQETIKTYLHDNYQVLFIGKKNHPESETALSYDGVHLITKEHDINSLKGLKGKIAITNQTTMSLFDIYHLTETIKKVFPEAVFIDEVCDATRLRQLAVSHQPKDIDHCFVVGDPKSNNSNKLVEISAQTGIPASLIESVEDIKSEDLKQFKKVSVTSGASTPTQITKEVIQYLQSFNTVDRTTHKPLSIYKRKNIFK